MSERVSERSIERSVVRWAKKYDIWAWKPTIPGWIGFPDRVFVFPNGQLVFIEFKATGKKPRASQVASQRILATRGFHIYNCDNKHDAIKILQGYLDVAVS
jgi:hypothetical protein